MFFRKDDKQVITITVYELLKMMFENKVKNGDKFIYEDNVYIFYNGFTDFGNDYRLDRILDKRVDYIFENKR